MSEPGEVGKIGFGGKIRDLLASLKSGDSHRPAKVVAQSGIDTKDKRLSGSIADRLHIDERSEKSEWTLLKQSKPPSNDEWSE